MGVDAIAKRYWVLVSGGLVAVAAYLQASGVGQLVAAHLTPNAAPPPSSARSHDTGRLPDKSAGPILSRNPFDSITGPLDGKTVHVAETNLPPPTLGADPYQDPPCSGFKSSLVTAADDPEWSFASLAGPDGSSQLRRKGDKVAAATVLHIGWFESPQPDLVPRVWMQEGGSRCIVEMGSSEKSAKPATPKPDAAPKDSKAAAKAKLTKDIEGKIKQVGENQWVVERGAVEQIIQNYAKLAGSLRTRPTKEGMRLSGLKPDNILSKLGMKNGDLLQSINGFDMSDPEKAVDAYAKLRSAGKLDITVARDGSPFTVGISIQ
jgi:general secretion pathway protein C